MKNLNQKMWVYQNVKLAYLFDSYNYKFCKRSFIRKKNQMRKTNI